MRLPPPSLARKPAGRACVLCVRAHRSPALLAVGARQVGCVKRGPPPPAHHGRRAYAVSAAGIKFDLSQLERSSASSPAAYEPFTVPLASASSQPAPAAATQELSYEPFPGPAFRPPAASAVADSPVSWRHQARRVRTEQMTFFLPKRGGPGGLSALKRGGPVGLSTLKIRGLVGLPALKLKIGGLVGLSALKRGGRGKSRRARRLAKLLARTIEDLLARRLKPGARIVAPVVCPRDGLAAAEFRAWAREVVGPAAAEVPNAHPEGWETVAPLPERRPLLPHLAKVPRALPHRGRTSRRTSAASPAPPGAMELVEGGRPGSGQVARTAVTPAPAPEPARKGTKAFRRAARMPKITSVHRPANALLRPAAAPPLPPRVAPGHAPRSSGHRAALRAPEARPAKRLAGGAPSSRPPPPPHTAANVGSLGRVRAPLAPPAPRAPAVVAAKGQTPKVAQTAAAPAPAPASQPSTTPADAVVETGPSPSKKQVKKRKNKKAAAAAAAPSPPPAPARVSTASVVQAAQSQDKTIKSKVAAAVPAPPPPVVATAPLTPVVPKQAKTKAKKQVKKAVGKAQASASSIQPSSSTTAPGPSFNAPSEVLIRFRSLLGREAACSTPPTATSAQPPAPEPIASSPEALERRRSPPGQAAPPPERKSTATPVEPPAPASIAPHPQVLSRYHSSSGHAAPPPPSWVAPAPKPTAAPVPLDLNPPPTAQLPAWATLLADAPPLAMPAPAVPHRYIQFEPMFTPEEEAEYRRIDAAERAARARRDEAERAARERRDEAERVARETMARLAAEMKRQARAAGSGGSYTLAVDRARREAIKHALLARDAQGKLLPTTEAEALVDDDRYRKLHKRLKMQTFGLLKFARPAFDETELYLKILTDKRKDENLAERDPAEVALLAKLEDTPEWDPDDYEAYRAMRHQLKTVDAESPRMKALWTAVPDLGPVGLPRHSRYRTHTGRYVLPPPPTAASLVQRTQAAAAPATDAPPTASTTVAQPSPPVDVAAPARPSEVVAGSNPAPAPSKASKAVAPPSTVSSPPLSSPRPIVNATPSPLPSTPRATPSFPVSPSTTSPLSSGAPSSNAPFFRPSSPPNKLHRPDQLYGIKRPPTLGASGGANQPTPFASHTARFEGGPGLFGTVGSYAAKLALQNDGQWGKPPPSQQQQQQQQQQR